MRINRKAALALLIVAGAVLGAACSGASGGSDPGQYEVTVLFNTSVTQPDIDDTAALLRAFDDDLDFVIMESFPPVGRAVLTTDEAAFCRSVKTELEAKSYIDGVTCGPSQETDQANPDEPVSSDEGEDAR